MRQTQCDTRGLVPSCFWCVSHSPICCSSHRKVERGPCRRAPIRNPPDAATIDQDHHQDNPRAAHPCSPAHWLSSTLLTSFLDTGPSPATKNLAILLWGLPGQLKSLRSQSRPRQHCGYRPLSRSTSSDFQLRLYSFAPLLLLPVLREAGFLLESDLWPYSSSCTIVQSDLIHFFGDTFGSSPSLFLYLFILPLRSSPAGSWRFRVFLLVEDSPYPRHRPRRTRIRFLSP